MVDLVFVAMFAVLPVMAWSIYKVRSSRNYRLHKWLQLTLATILLLAVAAFELEMRIFGWADRASPSPYWRDGSWNDWIDGVLAVHLACAVPTFLMWIGVIVGALRHFSTPPAPGAYSARHRFWGRSAGIGMLLTAVTGWWFYWLAFGA